MANIAQIREQLAFKPFRPFWLETTGGSRIRVSRAEWFYEVPFKNGELVVFDERVAHFLNYRDVLDTITIEQPPQEAS